MSGRLLPLPVLLRLAVTLARLVAVGLLGIGLSGLLALLFGWLFGKTFVAADPSGVTYTPSRCHDLFEYASHARTCEQAAVIHHFGEIVDSRVAAGLLGLIIAAFTMLAVRRWGNRLAPAEVLPDGFAATIGASLFGIAALLLLASGIAQTLFDHARGAGGTLSGGSVALPIAAWYTRVLYRIMRRRTLAGSALDEVPVWRNR